MVAANKSMGREILSNLTLCIETVGKTGKVYRKDPHALWE